MQNRPIISTSFRPTHTSSVSSLRRMNGAGGRMGFCWIWACFSVGEWNKFALNNRTKHFSVMWTGCYRRLRPLWCRWPTAAPSRWVTWTRFLHRSLDTTACTHTHTHKAVTSFHYWTPASDNMIKQENTHLNNVLPPASPKITGVCGGTWKYPFPFCIRLSCSPFTEKTHNICHHDHLKKLVIINFYIIMLK